MKIVHVMKNEKFTKSIVRFYDRFFNTGEHEILYVRYPKEAELVDQECDIQQTEFVYGMHDNFIRYLKSINCDYILLHSLLLTTKEKIELLSNKELFGKIVWIEWGADLYSWKQSFSAKGVIKNRVNQVFRNKVKWIVCIFPPDVDYFHKSFPNAQGTVFYAAYRGYPVDKEYLAPYIPKSKLECAINAGEPIYIQVGQNSMESLHHIRVLDALKKYKDENIMIFLPLSYGGTEEYADQVENYAKTLFPGKVIILRDLMSQQDYFNLTKKISIAIFDTDRQCGLGNINRLNFRNVKMYLSQQGPMYEYFKSRGVPVCKCEDINLMSYTKFIEPTEIIETEKFQKYINEQRNINIAVNQWRQIFETLRRNLDAA